MLLLLQQLMMVMVGMMVVVVVMVMMVVMLMMMSRADRRGLYCPSSSDKPCCPAAAIGSEISDEKYQIAAIADGTVLAEADVTVFSVSDSEHQIRKFISGQKEYTRKALNH